ncbi:DUF7224 domain-containing protein [Microtetraspora niveoalba]|uniref:DUF7224 domain-containing protein n=1 Tax=Microtetraspora niveoalba TaxID=46175 RepID=UPI00082A5568|nr:hypothetical protein [Microtetraspora niveoalba]
MRNIFLLEIRRSSLLLWIALLSLAVIAALFRRVDLWADVWPRASAEVAMVAGYLEWPVVAALGAWSAQRVHRSATDAQFTAARPAWQVAAVQFAALWCLALVPLALALLVGIAVAWGSPGFVWPAYPLSAVAAITVAAGLGFAAGLRWRSRLTALAVAVVFLVLMGLREFSEIFSFVPLSGPPHLTVAAAALATRCLMALLVVVLAVSLRGGGRARAIRATAAVAVPLSLLAVWAAGPLQIERAQPSHAACARPDSDPAPEVCVWPENRSHLAVATEAVGRLVEASMGTVPIPRRVVDVGLACGNGGSCLTFTATGDRGRVVGEMAFWLVPLADCEDPATTERFRANVMLETWLESRALHVAKSAGLGPQEIRDQDRAEVDGVLAQPAQSQRQWARRQARTAWSCDER